MFPRNTTVVAKAADKGRDEGRDEGPRGIAWDFGSRLFSECQGTRRSGSLPKSAVVGTILVGPVGTQEVAQFRHGPGVRRVRNPVLFLLGIGGVIVELRAFPAVVPFDIAIALGADAVAWKRPAPDLRECRLVPRRGGIIEQRPQTPAVEVGRRVQSAEIGERGIEIEEFDGAPGGDTFRLSSWSGDDQRDAGGILERALLHPKAMFAGVITMIAPEDDDGIVGELKPIQGIEQPTDLRVHEGDRRPISLEGLARLELGHAKPRMGLRRTERGRRDIRKVIPWPGRERHRFDWIELEILLRRDVRAMGTIESGGDEERPVAERSMSRMVSVATMPSVCSSSVPSARMKLRELPRPRLGVWLMMRCSSVLSRPFGLKRSFHDAGSSRPSVPIWPGLP
jgi:hypothetical protein